MEVAYIANRPFLISPVPSHSYFNAPLASAPPRLPDVGLFQAAPGDAGCETASSGLWASYSSWWWCSTCRKEKRRTSTWHGPRSASSISSSALRPSIMIIIFPFYSISSFPYSFTLSCLTPLSRSLGSDADSSWATDMEMEGEVPPRLVARPGLALFASCVVIFFSGPASTQLRCSLWLLAAELGWRPATMCCSVLWSWSLLCRFSRMIQAKAIVILIRKGSTDPGRPSLADVLVCLQLWWICDLPAAFHLKARSSDSSELGNQPRNKIAIPSNQSFIPFTCMDSMIHPRQASGGGLVKIDLWPN